MHMYPLCDPGCHITLSRDGKDSWTYHRWRWFVCFGSHSFLYFCLHVSSSTSMGLLKLWNWNICLAELCFMLLTRNALGPYHLGEPQQTLHWLEPVLWWCGWSKACGSWYDCKTHLSNNHQGTWKGKVCDSQVSVDYTDTSQGHIARSWGEKES